MSVHRNSYLENEILQADPLKLVQMLYRGAIGAIRAAQASLATGDHAERARQVSKAQEIVAELMLSVNREEGGEVAANLVELYDYVLHTLGTAHTHQSAPHFDQAIAPLQTLLEAWEEICTSEVPNIPHAAPEAPTYSPVSVSF